VYVFLYVYPVYLEPIDATKFSEMGKSIGYVHFSGNFPYNEETTRHSRHVLYLSVTDHKLQVLATTQVAAL